MCIDLQRVLTGSRDGDVTEPSSDDIEFNTSLQEMHRGGLASIPDAE